MGGGGFSPGFLSHASGFSPGCCGSAWLQLACLGIKVVRQRLCPIVDRRLRPCICSYRGFLMSTCGWVSTFDKQKTKRTNTRRCPILIIIPILITRLCPISRGFARPRGFARSVAVALFSTHLENDSTLKHQFSTKTHKQPTSGKPPV